MKESAAKKDFGALGIGIVVTKYQREPLTPLFVQHDVPVSHLVQEYVFIIQQQVMHVLCETNSHGDVQLFRD